MMNGAAALTRSLYNGGKIQGVLSLGGGPGNADRNHGDAGFPSGSEGHGVYDGLGEPPLRALRRDE